MRRNFETMPQLFNVLNMSKKKNKKLLIEMETGERINRLTNNSAILKTAFFTSCLNILFWKLTNTQNVNLLVPVNNETYQYPHLSLYMDIKSDEIVRDILNHHRNLIKESLNTRHDYSEEKYKELLKENEAQRVYLAIRSFNNKFTGYNEIEIENSQLLIDIHDNKIPMEVCFYIPDNAPKAQFESFSSVFSFLIEQMLDNYEKPVQELSVVNKITEDKLVNTGWNKNKQWENPEINQLFREVCEQQKSKVAIRVSADAEIIYDDLYKQSSTFNISTLRQCCFIRKEILFCTDIQLHDSDFAEFDTTYFIKSTRNYCAIVNLDLLCLIDSLSGQENVDSIKKIVKDKKLKLMAYFYAHKYKDQCLSAKRNDINCDSSISDILNLMSVLCYYHIIEIASVNPIMHEIKFCKETKQKTNNIGQNDVFQKTDKDIIIFGDTPSGSSVGILYLSSFLVRNGISVYCNYNDNNWDTVSLTNDIENLLSIYSPRYFAISMKWSPHIYRVTEILKIVKTTNPNIITIVGGDTASWFYNELIEYSCIDYVVRGDGEIPLLYICKGETQNLPNCVYKRDGKIIAEPITYIQDLDSCDSYYLSNLEEYLPENFKYYSSTMFIHTHRGCSYNCIYCGGRAETQKKNFCRAKTTWRKASLVRNDIMQIKPYVSALMFDFDDTNGDLLHYLKEIWEGIDLSKHFCVLFYTVIPSNEVVDYISRKFAYIRWNIDICSMSENHRLLLARKKLVKPQPTNKEIYSFLDYCKRYSNIEVDINVIIGLPWYSDEDIQAGEEFMQNIIESYTNLVDIHWGRLHAQPGDAISPNADEYGMVSYATTFAEFKKYSKMNFESNKTYPSLTEYKYPYILYQDPNMNAKISQHFSRLNSILTKRKSRQLLYSQITYGDLNKYSDMLFIILSKKGIQRGNVVGICVTDPILQAIAIFAIIKAGAVYIPLNIDDTDSHFNFKLTNSRVSLLVYDVKPKTCDLGVDTLNILETSWFEEKPRNLITESYQADDSIYILYTSGTSGEPKGVECMAKSLYNYILWRKKQYLHSPSDITLQILPSYFDGYYAGFYGCLFIGGTLIIANNYHRRDIDIVIKLIREQAVTNMSIIPSLYMEILRRAKEDDLLSLRDVVLGGEKTSEAIIESSNKRNIQLINEYGPTECTITATFNMNMFSGSTNQIGRPIDATGIYILNEDLNILPLGIRGEICISGAGVAKGYINSPQNEKKSFTQDPFKPDCQMYRTGDLGIRNEDGSFQYVGRIDSQVKVLGYRIELNAIEISISRLPYVLQAVVIAKNQKNANILYAFIVTRTGVTLSQIRDDLSIELPQYMIPNHFIFLDSMPITENGKVDKDKLWQCFNEIKQQDSLNNSESITECEREILSFWQDVLNIKHIDIDENFFEAGGNSLQLIQLHERLNERYTNQFSVTDLFSYPTVRLQASYLANK